jgi:putative nucleotidyltransferase with HDIG domain
MVLRAVESPVGAWGILVTLAAAVVAAGLVVWTRERPLAAVGRVMHETRVVREAVVTRDAAAEADQREAARARVPRAFTANTEVIAEIVQSVESLPAAVASAETLDRVDASLREKFALTPEILAAVRETGGVEGWRENAGRLGALLLRKPILDERAFQRALTEGLNVEIRLVLPGPAETGESPAGILHVPRAEVVNLAGGALREEAVKAIVRAAGFTGVLAGAGAAVSNRLLAESRPTFRYDEALTAADLAAAAASVPPRTSRFGKGSVVYARGDRLSAEQAALDAAERRQFAATAGAGAVWWPRAGLAAWAFAVAGAAAGYTALFVPRIRRSAARQVSAAAMLVLALAGACVGTVLHPALAPVWSAGAVTLVAMLLTVAYEPRVALAYGVLLGTLVCAALDRTIGDFAILVAGIGATAWLLRDVRERGAMVRGALGAGAAMGLTTLVVGMVERPIPEATAQVAWDAAMTAATAVLAGGVVLFLLPLVERIFGVATGLTLIELRDPKQPLLRELQQRAPGTYNHSLNVAAIAEAAADAIGANSLLTYVGGLYHDIGKMNKPEYFIENRVGGGNRHDKLTPALSLLVIVGHVKDGVELAIEFGLPKALRHFIEAHHGTTLVEYFFHRATQKAKAAAQEDADIADLEREEEGSVPGGLGVDLPDEAEYRYPGPKPETKEVAILMIADAVESATRTLEDPTPARVEQLVRDLATKRLLDGQFDQCALTLRELNQIAESIARTVTSIYHGRVAYPGARARA